MAKGKIFTDEQILEALVNRATVKGAAEEVGCSTRLVFQRLQNDDFRACLCSLRAERLRAIAGMIDIASLKAVTMLTDMVEDAAVAPSDRLKAASLILDHAAGVSDRLSKAETAAYSAGQKLQLDAWSSHDIWQGVNDAIT